MLLALSSLLLSAPVEFDLLPRPGEQPIVEVVSRFDRALISRIGDSPSELFRLAPRQFEEFVAELWRGFGYEVELTAQTRDGGKDIIALQQREVKSRYIIECKRYAADNKVGIDVVQRVLGVRYSERASMGIIATTSSFTAPAQAVLDDHPWELDGRNFEAIQGWIRQYLAER